MTTAFELQVAMNKERKLLEAMRNLSTPKSADEIAAYTKTPRSSTYKSLKELETIGVVDTEHRLEVGPSGRNVRVKVYAINVQRANEYSKPILGETIPQIYNALSKKLYSLLELAERYDPSSPTGGAKASDAYLQVATLLLELSFADPDSVESAKQRLHYRQYLQQALAVIKNVANQTQQMLDDPRLWTEDLHVLSANETVRANKDLIHDRASRISI